MDQTSEIKVSLSRPQRLPDTEVREHANPSAKTQQLSDGLFQQAIQGFEGLDSRFEPDRKQLAELRDRLAEGRFHLAVLGQFKRGKSTFLNALLGYPLLPSSVLPLTAIPTFLHAGQTFRAEAIGDAGHVIDRTDGNTLPDIQDFLSRMVTEEANPKNRLGIAHVQVYVHSPLLKEGVVLIDTPGIGSTFLHNTEVTLNFLPQCDAAIFLISADPPISEVELAFLKRVQARAPRLFFVLNKADYLSESEKKDAVAFFKSILHEKAGLAPDIDIFAVSSKKGLEARIASESTQWKQSGLADVEDHLITFLAREKAAVLRRAVSAKATDCLSNVLMQIQILLQALRLPLSELEARQRLFESKLSEAQHRKRILNDLLTGERNRLMEFLEEQANDLRKRGHDHFDRILQEIIVKNQVIDEGRQTLLTALPVFFERELGEMSHAFHDQVTLALRPQQQQADEWIESIRRAAAELFDIPYRAPESADAFKMARQPFWTTQQRASFMNPIPEGILYQLMPRRMRRLRMKKHLKQEIDQLVFQNVENLRWVTLQNLNQALREFSLQLGDRFHETIEATHGALLEAGRKRKEATQSVSVEIEQLEKAAAGFEVIREQFKPC
jgi:ribosome biogenesis GTPase A/cell division protein ZapA (FtsZ GTPase activity inhibitor)